MDATFWINHPYGRKKLIWILRLLLQIISCIFFKVLVTVTAMNYQLQLQKIVGNYKHLCVAIKSNPAIREGKCIQTNTSKTFSVFAGGNIKNECEYNQIHCDDGTCISQEHSCFDHIYCLSKFCVCGNISQLVNDQHYCRHLCMPQNCSWPSHYFQCGSGGCIQFTLICVGKADCIDASDEMCGFSTRSTLQKEAFKGKSHTEVLYLIGREHYCLGYQCLWWVYSVNICQRSYSRSLWWTGRGWATVPSHVLSRRTLWLWRQKSVSMCNGLAGLLCIGQILSVWFRRRTKYHCLQERRTSQRLYLYKLHQQLQVPSVILHPLSSSLQW